MWVRLTGTTHTPGTSLTKNSWKSNIYTEIYIRNSRSKWSINKINTCHIILHELRSNTTPFPGLDGYKRIEDQDKWKGTTHPNDF